MLSKLHYKIPIVQFVFSTIFKSMKSIQNIIWTLLLPLLTYGQIEGNTQSTESYIEIEGHSNINSFELKASIDHTTNYTSRNQSHQLNLEVPFTSFKTKKKLIYNNFLEMVNHHDYPDLKISFSTTDIKNPLVNTIECDISLSGVTKHYTIPVYCFQVGDNSFYIKGKNTINLSAFALEPPSKLFKLIKIKDDVEVNFALLVENSDLDLNSFGF